MLRIHINYTSDWANIEIHNEKRGIAIRHYARNDNLETQEKAMKPYNLAFGFATELQKVLCTASCGQAKNSVEITQKEV